MKNKDQSSFINNPKKRSLLFKAFRFLRRRPLMAVGVGLLLLILLLALVGPFLLPYQPNQVFERFMTSSQTHLLGTDSQGYDVFTRLVYGARTTLLIALAAMGLSLVLGTAFGAIAGYIGGFTDLVLMRFVDFAMSFPGFLLAMVFVAVLGPALEHVILAVGFVGAPIFARQVRAEVIRVKAAEFVSSARALGLSPTRIFFFHVMRNSLNPVIVLGTLDMGTAILEVAGLNFLGLGGDPYRIPEWGLMLTQGWSKLPDAQLQVTCAGLMIFLTVLGFNLFGDGLKDKLA